MAERKNLTITEVNEIQKVGDKQIPKLSFKARGNEAEEAISYFTFKSSLFDYIKIGQTITADIETEQRGEYTNRRIVQVYKDGQGVVSKGQGRSYGKSPEELEQQARLMILAYSKDLVVADKISLEGMLKEADRMYTWLKMTDKIIAPIPQTKVSPLAGEETEKLKTPTGKKVQNIVELKKLLMKHKIPTHEAKEILSIKEFDDLKDLDKAWEDIKKAKGIT